MSWSPLAELGSGRHAATGTSLAIRRLSAPMAPLGLQVSPELLDAALGRLEHGHTIDSGLDALIYEALGWTVDAGAGAARRRLAWRCRSPLSLGWELLPSPTGDERAAAKLVPWHWSYSAGVVRGQPRAWAREDRPRSGREPRFSECNRTTVPRALTAAALFAHRQLVLGS